MLSKVNRSFHDNSLSLLVLLLIAGSLVISIRYPDSDSKFIDLAQAGLGGYLAILVQSKNQSVQVKSTTTKG